MRGQKEERLLVQDDLASLSPIKDYQQDRQSVMPCHIPIGLRLQENRDRRDLIEKIREREKQEILKKRRDKEENVQNKLKQRQEARESAKFMLTSYRHNSTQEQAESRAAKEEQIEGKINQCRRRADEYRTNYQWRLKEHSQKRRRDIEQKLQQIQARQQQTNDQYHLAEWKAYETKLKSKYKGNPRSPQSQYLSEVQKKNQINRIIKLYQDTESESPAQQLIIKHESPAEQKGPSLHSRNTKNPIYFHRDITVFGLQKSIKDPEEIMEGLLGFVKANFSVEESEDDSELINKFEDYLAEIGGL